MKPLHELLKDKVVNCQTQEEAREFMQIADEQGYTWLSGDRLIGKTYWLRFGRYTFYMPCKDKKICFGNLGHIPPYIHSITFLQFKQLINENNMETKEVKIQVPEGYEIDKENSTFELIKFKPISKVVTYEDVAKDLFCKNHHFLVHQGNIYGCSSCLEYASKKEVRCVSAKQAEKLLAINKLMNVAKYLNEKENNNKYYYFLKLINGEIYTDYFTSKNSCYGIVCFNSNELAKKAVEILGEETIKLALSTDW